jgi:hypothetical protein
MTGKILGERRSGAEAADVPDPGRISAISSLASDAGWLKHRGPRSHRAQH